MKEKLEQEVVQLAQKIINNPLFFPHMDYVRMFNRDV